MKNALCSLAALLFASLSAASAAEIQKGEMAGYLLVGPEKVPDEYNAGFSLYAAAWPLLEQYPGHNFQTGLVGTWMRPPDCGPGGPRQMEVRRSRRPVAG